MLTIAGAFQRNHIYKDSIDNKTKANFRNYIESLLEQIKIKYAETVSEKSHLANLDKLKRDVENQYRNILFNSAISFGTIQKLLNLYLKYMWTCGFIKEEPPHCPIDKNILKKIKDHKTNWTKMDKIGYCKAIKKIKKKAFEEQLSIAGWELKNFIK